MQQLGECPEPLPSQVAELPAMGFLHWFIEAGQEFESGRRDPGRHHSPVPGFPAASDQAAPFQAVEKASDVRIPRNHAVGNLATGEPFDRSAQDAEHIILRHGKVLGLENRDQAAGQHVGRAQ